MSLQQLREKRADCASKRKALHETALAEARDFTDEEQTEFDTLGTEAESLARQIGRAEVIDAEQVAMATMGERKTFANEPRTTNRNLQIEVKPAELHKDSFGGYRPGDRVQDATDGDHRQWFVGFANDVYMAGKGQISERLSNWQRASLAAGDGLQTVIGHDGGYLIPSTFGSLIDKVALEAAVVRPRATIVPMSTPKISFPAVDDTTHATTVFGGILAYWKSEEAQLTSSKPAFKEVALEVHKLTAMAYLSGEMLDWSPISMANWLPNKLAQAIAYKEDDGFINGSGGAGEPVGLLNSPGAISITAETGQAADTVVFDNIIKADARVWDLTGGNIIWIANRTVKPQLPKLTLSEGASAWPVFLPPDNAQGRPLSTLYGFPIVFTEKAPVLGDAGDITLVNVGEYLVADGTGKMRTDRDMGLKFDYDQVAFRVITYSGGAMPWRAAFTPKNGDTLHPVIKIAERA